MRLPKSFATSIAASLSLTIAIWLGSFPLLALAQTYVPPDRGLPGRREGGGTRSGTCAQGQPTLTALMPNTNYGQTVSPYPTWFWYVPQTVATTAEFVLLDSSDNEVYRTTFQTSDTPGIISLSLPTDQPPLTVDQDYHWYFSLVCDPQDRSADLFAEGWTRLVENSALSTEIEAAAEIDRPSLYASAGIWQDALASLVALRRQQPTSSAVASRWRIFLGSVGLDNLAAQPLVQSSEAQNFETQPPEAQSPWQQQSPKTPCVYP
jgi:hypothetical protein